MLKLAAYHPSASGFSSTTEVGSKTFLPVLSDGLYEFQKALGSTHIFPIDMYMAEKIYFFSQTTLQLFFSKWDMTWDGPKEQNLSRLVNTYSITLLSDTGFALWLALPLCFQRFPVSI